MKTTVMPSASKTFLSLFTYKLGVLVDTEAVLWRR